MSSLIRPPQVDLERLLSEGPTPTVRFPLRNQAELFHAGHTAIAAAVLASEFDELGPKTSDFSLDLADTLESISDGLGEYVDATANRPRRALRPDLARGQWPTFDDPTEFTEQLRFTQTEFDAFESAITPILAETAPDSLTTAPDHDGIERIHLIIRSRPGRWRRSTRPSARCPERRVWEGPSIEKVPLRSALILMLWRLSWPHRWAQEGEHLFGRDHSTLSRVFTRMLAILHPIASRCMTSEEALRLHLPSVAVAEQYREGFRKLWDDDAVEVVAAIDGTHRAIARPTYFQDVYYSGYHNGHCAQWQVISFPTGLVHCSRGQPGYDSDRGMLRRCRQSRIMSRHWTALGLDDTDMFVLGDAIYPPELYPWLWSTAGLPQALSRAWGNLRAGIEHFFGITARNWACMSRSESMQLYHTSPIKLYETALFLTNVLAILQPNQIRQRHGVKIPFTLEQYLALGRTQPGETSDEDRVDVPDSEDADENADEDGCDSLYTY